MLFDIFQIKQIKYGKHIFTFQTVKKLYQLKEDFFEKLPNSKLIFYSGEQQLYPLRLAKQH